VTLIKKAFIIALVLFFVLLFLRFFLGGPEDSWICSKGVWVKHGNPIGPKPEIVCKDKK
jgi:hypothetical protein